MSSPPCCTLPPFILPYRDNRKFRGQEAVKKLAKCTHLGTAADVLLWLACKSGHPAAFPSLGIARNGFLIALQRTRLSLFPGKSLPILFLASTALGNGAQGYH